ncbi:C39 family peptidase [Bacillus sp. 03113]|uniref:C39 family peptidase n=1 Tax=Bacillus sp. 03113 TaxID=2578211 RepID=UPI00215D05C9|nr:C39 family peptidase [Bacillus sp. 03113]
MKKIAILLFCISLLVLSAYFSTGKQKDSSNSVKLVTSKGTTPKNQEKQDILSENKEAPVGSQSIVLEAPLIAQKPELYNGCEVTSLAMMLQYAGLNVDKMTLASKIKKVPFGQNPNDGFVGDITGRNKGLAVYHGPITELANQYLNGRAVDLTGSSFNVVYQQLNNKKPVLVINNVHFNRISESYFETWHTRTGDIKITFKEHAVLVTGYDDQYIYFNDPLAVSKNRKVLKEEFIAGWEQMGKQSISFY